MEKKKLYKLFQRVEGFEDAQNRYIPSAIHKNPYAIRIIKDFLQCFIQARQNGFSEASMQKLQDAVYRLYIERNRELQCEKISLVNLFMRNIDDNCDEIIGNALPTQLTTNMYSRYNPLSFSTIKEYVAQVKNIPQDYNEELIQAYKNINTGNINTIKGLITIIQNGNNLCQSFNNYYGYEMPPLVTYICKKIGREDEYGNMDYNYVKNDKIDIDQLSQEICELLKKGNIKSYEEFRKEQDDQAKATLENIFGIITEDELHYNTSCCGLMKYNNDTLYNQGINSKAEGIDNRYAEVLLHSPLCCGLCS